MNEIKKTDPIPDDVLAKAIVKISDGMQRLVSSGLNRDAVVVLLHHETKLPFRDINRILTELSTLARKYTTNSTR